MHYIFINMLSVTNVKMVLIALIDTWQCFFMKPSLKMKREKQGDFVVSVLERY